jgi:hypothetical protein
MICRPARHLMFLGWLKQGGDRWDHSVCFKMRWRFRNNVRFRYGFVCFMFGFCEECKEWRFCPSGMWRRVVRQIVSDVSEHYRNYRPTWTWRWRHHDLSKHRTATRHIPEDLRLQNYRCENIKFRAVMNLRVTWKAWRFLYATWDFHGGEYFFVVVWVVTPWSLVVLIQS